MVRRQSEATEARSEEVYRQAYEVFCETPDWATYYRKVLGLEGLVRQNYPTPEALGEFEKTDAYQRIQEMLKSLRQRKTEAPSQEPTRMITVRLPVSLHEALRNEAFQHQTSMNKLCITKLLQILEEEFAPDGQAK